MSAQQLPAAVPEQVLRGPERGRLRKSWDEVRRFARKKPLGFVGGLLVIFYLFVAILSPYVAPYSATSSVALPLQPPSFDHWFGTDSVGRDTFSRVLVGSQVSLAIGFSVMLISITVSTILGMISGYFLGPIDYVLQRSGEAFQAFPTLILYFAIIAMFGRPSSEGGSIFQVAWDLRVLILALSVGAFFGGSRVVRGATLSLRQQDFVLGAQAVGASDKRIILTHIFPNVFPYVIVAASSSIAGIVLAESALNFLGLGVSPGTPAWGSDLAGRNRAFFVDAPWLALAPGLALSFMVLGFNLFGDGLRDVLDPRLRGSGRRTKS